MRGKPKEPEYKGNTYNQWVNAYNKGQASYEDYLIARKILVDGIHEEGAIKEVEDARAKRGEPTEEGGESSGKSQDSRQWE